MAAFALFATPLPAQAAGPPQITASWSEEVSSAASRLGAEVSPNGIATTYRFEYLTQVSYESNLSSGKDPFTGASRVPSFDVSIGSGTTTLAVSQQLSGLKPSTKYRFRAVAQSAEGQATGFQRTFVTREVGGPLTLLDHRAWEMVSPVDKNGGEILPPGQVAHGGVFQAALEGNAVTYSSPYAFGDAQGAPVASQYVSTRRSTGWETENVTLPTESGAYGEDPDGVPYQLFAESLGRGVVLVREPCAEEEPCPRRYLLRESDGTTIVSPETPDLRFAGASPDLGSIVLSTCAALTPNATEVPAPGGCDEEAANIYEWRAGSLAAINIAPGDSASSPGARLAAPIDVVSVDGARIYWSYGGELYVREGSSSEQLDASLGTGQEFQAASGDGSVAFFTHGGHLFRYLVATGGATDLTPAGGVKGVLGAAKDGSAVYYLTGAGLHLWRNGSADLVAAAADPSNHPPATGTARVSADGARIAFLSSESLTGYDNRNADTGELESQVYLYDAVADLLRCISCNPTGSRPLGPSMIPPVSANGAGAEATRAYKPRSLSSDGRRLFFDSRDALVTQDVNNAPDVYEWEALGAGSCAETGGCLELISSGQGPGASFVDASADGVDVFFLTAASLVPSDPGSQDLYDARAGGGFPEPITPLPCVADACQSLPSPPEDPTPGTLVRGAGNPPVKLRKPKAKGHRRKKRRQARATRGSGRRNQAGGKR